MNRLMEFLVTTAWSGLVVVLPVLLVCLLLAEVFDLLIALATPIADVLAPDALALDEHPAIAAVVLLAACAFLLGLVARSEGGRRLGIWLESRLLIPIPAYAMVKGLTGALLEVRDNDSFQPALLNSGNGGFDPVYVVGDYGDDKVTVLLPWTPASFAGSLKIVARSEIVLLDIKLGDFSRIVTNLGMGMEDARPRAGTGG